MEASDATALAIQIVEAQMDKIVADGKGFVRNDMIALVEREIIVALHKPRKATPAERPKEHILNTAVPKPGQPAKRYWADDVFAKVRVWYPERLLGAVHLEVMLGCFNWKTTPQGFSWWEDQKLRHSYGRMPDREAVDFIDGLLNYSRRAAKPAPKWDFSKAGGVDVYKLKRVLAGDVGCLYGAIDYVLTKRVYQAANSHTHYWGSRAGGTVPLSDEDKVFLQSLLDYHEAKLAAKEF
jgi:hypothetical protein